MSRWKKILSWDEDVQPLPPSTIKIDIQRDGTEFGRQQYYQNFTIHDKLEIPVELVHKAATVEEFDELVTNYIRENRIDLKYIEEHAERSYGDFESGDIITTKTEFNDPWSSDLSFQFDREKKFLALKEEAGPPPTPIKKPRRRR